MLRRRADRLIDTDRQRIEAALTATDPDAEIWAAWIVAQYVMAIYPAPTPETGRARADPAIRAALDCPVPEVARLGCTLHAWHDELVAYSDTVGASNGPVEALNLLFEKTRRDAHGLRNPPTTDCDYSSPAAASGTLTPSRGSEPAAHAWWRRAG